LMGCIQSGVRVNIVRLTYNSNNPTARLLDQNKLLKLMRHPLLRSSGVLNALFYDAVVVTEADTDRAFYDEINERLLSAGDARGISHCLFINAQNKQTIWEIVRPLRELGIPAAGIVDIDVIKEGGEVWKKPLEGAFVPELSHSGLQVDRGRLLEAFGKKVGKDMKRHGGTAILDGTDRDAATDLFSRLAEYGVFVVPGGEVESWLQILAVTGHGPEWLIAMFEKMGDDPDQEAYVRPGAADVWAFLDTIRRWIGDPRRKGIPLS